MEIGILIDGKYYALEWADKLIDQISESIKQKIMSEISNRPTIEEKNYTVDEVARLVNKSTQTITRHIRLGYLKAYKAGGGKSWIITHEDCLNYKLNKFERM